jgi:hypothetical protein
LKELFGLETGKINYTHVMPTILEKKIWNWTLFFMEKNFPGVSMSTGYLILSTVYIYSLTLSPGTRSVSNLPAHERVFL